MPPGEGNGSGAQDWTDESLYQQNSDWIGTTSAPHFDLQHATSLHDVQRRLQLPSASADPELDPLRAGATGAYASFDHGQSWNLDDEYQGDLHGWSGLLVSTAFDPSSSQPLTGPNALGNIDDAGARPPTGSLSAVSGALGQNSGSQTAQRNFTSHRSFLSSPALREASKTPPAAAPALTRLHSIAQEPSSSRDHQITSKTSTGGQTLSPSSAQAPPTRKRKGGQRPPSSRQAFKKTPFQPNEEEEARRIHMASVSRGGSLVSSTSSQSRRTNEQESVRTEENLRAAESRMLESMGAGRTPGVLRTPQLGDGPSEQFSLPPGKGFPIQIGSELFRLSGASIMSDCYMVQPTDGAHYVRLFADAQFYSLPRLISQLFDSETVVQIGGENFQIPRDIFSGLGDTPNFFSLGFAVFFSTPNGVFPGLHPAGLLRPPPIKPPTVPNRSAKVFSELLHLLRGYPLTIRDDNHRAELLRDCRYFNLKGLEQKLIMHEVSHNAERNKSEIVIRLDDIRQSGISFVEEPSPADRSPLAGWVQYARPFVDEESYELILEIADESTKIDFRSMRAEFYGLTKTRISKLFQVVANKMNLPVNVPLGLMMSAGGAAAQDASPGNTPLSEDRVKIRIGGDAYIILDGDEYATHPHGLDAGSDEEMQESPVLETGRVQSSATWPTLSSQVGQSRSAPVKSPQQPPPRKRKRRGSLDDFGEWIIRRGQWRLRVQPRVETGKRGSGGIGSASIGAGGSSIGGIGEGAGMEIVMHAVKLDAVSGQRGRNMMRSFLTGSV